jgi:hypothetical protein
MEADFDSTDQSTTHNSIDDIQDAIRGTKLDLEEQIREVQQSISSASDSLRESLEADRSQLQRCLESLAQARQAVNTRRPRIVLERNRAGQSSRAIFGTDSMQPHFDLTVAENQAERDAVVSAGVYSPQTMQALLGVLQPSNHAHALVLQVLQNQSLETNLESLYSVPRGLPERSSPSSDRISAFADAEDSQLLSQNRNTSGEYLE